ncbi:MAG: zinc dependent phospholipase C family protein [Acidobacteriaceae bacterium]
MPTGTKPVGSGGEAARPSRHGRSPHVHHFLTGGNASGYVLLWLLLLVCGLSARLSAYSFLTHQDLIDVAWNDSIRPLLLERYPGATEAQLRQARAYAYGGATIQDIGYYPFGHQYFSNLTHYVRSGDFVINLLANSRNVDDYAFALGALSHYVGDNDGHRFATNPSTAIEFPKLGKKYGPIVTYDESPNAHIRTEFAYDVEQLSRHRFAPAGYLDSVGFHVPRALLERAFVETYGVPLRSVLGHEAPAIQSYHKSVGKLLPAVADAEALVYRNDFPPDRRTPAFQLFEARQLRSRDENGWTNWKHKEGFQVHLLALGIELMRFGPKIGPLSALAIRGPDMETDRWFIESLNRSDADYVQLLKTLAANPNKVLSLPNRDLDTGHRVRPGAYPLTDQTYAKLLRQLTAQPGRPLPASLRQNILAYYADPKAPIVTRKNPKAWKRVQAELPVLCNMQTIGAVSTQPGKLPRR